MLPKEPKMKKGLGETLARNLRGTAAEKLAMFEKLREKGVDRRELAKIEDALRTFAAMQKGKD